MTNLFKQKGMATLIVTVILMVSALLMIGFAASYSALQQKTSGNQYANDQAFQAADAGLDFGIVYFVQNSAAILATASGGFINYGPTDSNITNVSLSNNSKFSVVSYKNPTANNYQLIQVTVTGTSTDGTSTHTIQQQIYQVPASLYSVETQGSVSVNGHGGGITGNQAVDAGGTVDPSASAGGTVIQNDSSLSSMSASAFFSHFFGMTTAAMQSTSTVYANSGSVPWGPALSGNIWVNGNVSLPNTTVGSVANPVLLIVNGNFSAAGNATINGILYVMGTSGVGAGNATVNGAVISQGNLTFSGNGAVNYNSTIVQNLLGSVNPGFGGYGRVSGSWKDF